MTTPLPIPATDLAALLLPSRAGAPLSWVGGYLTAWDDVTRANTVAVGAVVYTGLFCVNPAGLAVGPVLLAITPAQPIIIGRLYGPTV